MHSNSSLYLRAILRGNSEQQWRVARLVGSANEALRNAALKCEPAASRGRGIKR
jgi:hypothetical protein